MRSGVLALLSLVAAWIAPQAQAFGLGEAEVRSHIGQPLSVDIPLILSLGEHLKEDELKVRVAPPAAHQRSGLEYPYRLGVKARIQSRAGHPVIHLYTSRPVSEPLLSLLVQMESARGRLVKEISFFLDPPMPQAPVTPAADSAGEAVTRPVAPAAPERRTPRADDGHYGPVASGESLYRIARALRPDVDVRAMARALYRRNPQAFGGSEALLLQGAMLTVPTGDEIAQAALEAPSRPPDTRARSPAAVHDGSADRVPAQGGQGVGGEFHIMAPGTPDEGTGPEVSTGAADGEPAGAGQAGSQGGTPVPAPGSVQAQLRAAQAQIATLRTDSRLTRETLARLEQQLLASKARLEAVVAGYQAALKMLERPAVRRPVEGPMPPVVAPAAVEVSRIPAVGTPPARRDLVPLWGLGLAASVLWLVAISILRVMRPRSVTRLDDEGPADPATAAGPSPSSAPAPVPAPAHRVARQAPTGGADRPGRARAASPPSLPLERPPIMAGHRAPGGRQGPELTEYLSAAQRNLTDPQVHEEIIDETDNHEVKLLLLTFYRELGRHDEMRGLAARMLARDPGIPSPIREQIEAFRDHGADLPDPDEQPTLAVAVPEPEADGVDPDTAHYAPGVPESDPIAALERGQGPGGETGRSRHHDPDYGGRLRGPAR